MLKKLGRKNSVRLLLLAGALLLGLNAEAATNIDGITQSATGIVDTAQTVFVSVGTLIAGAVGFFVVVKIVHWIRK